MSKPKKIPKISEAELEILNILWSRDGATIAETHELLRKTVRLATVQTQLNRLVEKGVVQRSKTRPAVYTAIVSPDEISSRQLDLLVRNVGGGSVFPLIANLVRGRRFSQEEINALQELVATLNREN